MNRAAVSKGLLRLCRLMCGRSPTFRALSDLNWATPFFFCGARSGGEAQTIFCPIGRPRAFRTSDGKPQTRRTLYQQKHNMNLDYFINRLSENCNVFESLLRGVTNDQAVWKPTPEKWSMLEVVN